METAMDMIPFRGDEWQQSNRLQRIYTVVKVCYRLFIYFFQC